MTKYYVEQIRAKDGIRTRDPDLGKVVLYQLSYFRSISRLGTANINIFLFRNVSFSKKKDDNFVL